MRKGFTMVELLAVIGIIAILVIIVIPNVIDIFNESVDDTMQAQEGEAIDAAKLFVQDYCTHSIDDTHRQECNSKFKKIDDKTKYVCISTLQEKEYFDTIFYKSVPCSGIVVLKANENDIYDTGNAYLYCGDAGNYIYKTEGGNYESYLSSCN